MKGRIQGIAILKMKSTKADRHTARRGVTLTGLIMTAVMVLAFSPSPHFTPASARTSPSAALCGDGSAPDYGFTYDLQQAHWTVNWQNYASEQAVTQVDTVLDRLNGDSIAQTMILFEAQDQVGNRVNCAVHFLRYMKLGLPTGERKDNGFVFLIVVEPTRIDVHYGVGLGLPALTAPELTTLNRDAEDAYQSSHSMDQALLTLVQEFDTVARNKYAPLIRLTATPQEANLPPIPAGPAGLLSICGLLCLGILFLGFLLWAFSQLGRAGINFGPSGSGSDPWGSGFPLDGGGGGPWTRGGGGGGEGQSTRGGDGSGRSGRGN
jgi:hypothetical protein